MPIAKGLCRTEQETNEKLAPLYIAPLQEGANYFIFNSIGMSRDIYKMLWNILPLYHYIGSLLSTLR